MAAVDLTSYVGEIRSVTMSATPGNAQEVQLSVNTTYVTVAFIAADDVTPVSGLSTWTGTDAVAIGTHHMPIPAGVLAEIDVQRRGVGTARSIYLASATASALAKIEQFHK